MESIWNLYQKLVLIAFFSLLASPKGARAEITRQPLSCFHIYGVESKYGIGLRGVTAWVPPSERPKMAPAVADRDGVFWWSGIRVLTADELRVASKAIEAQITAKLSISNGDPSSTARQIFDMILQQAAYKMDEAFSFNYLMRFMFVIVNTDDPAERLLYEEMKNEGTTSHRLNQILLHFLQVRDFASLQLPFLKGLNEKLLEKTDPAKRTKPLQLKLGGVYWTGVDQLVKRQPLEIVQRILSLGANSEITSVFNFETNGWYFRTNGVIAKPEMQGILMFEDIDPYDNGTWQTVYKSKISKVRAGQVVIQFNQNPELLMEKLKNEAHRSTQLRNGDGSVTRVQRSNAENRYAHQETIDAFLSAYQAGNALTVEIYEVNNGEKVLLAGIPIFLKDAAGNDLPYPDTVYYKESEYEWAKFAMMVAADRMKRSGYDYFYGRMVSNYSYRVSFRYASGSAVRYIIQSAASKPKKKIETHPWLELESLGQ